MKMTASDEKNNKKIKNSNETETHGLALHKAKMR